MNATPVAGLNYSNRVDDRPSKTICGAATECQQKSLPIAKKYKKISIKRLTTKVIWFSHTLIP
jgi:hypothetical protein